MLVGREGQVDMAMPKVNRFSELPTDYAGLVAMHVPRPLHDAVDEANVERIIEMMAGHDLTDDQADYLDILSDQLLKYQERERSRTRRRSVIERFAYLLEESGTTPAGLQKILACSQTKISLLLNGKRELTKDDIRRLAGHFKLRADYFL